MAITISTHAGTPTVPGSDSTHMTNPFNLHHDLDGNLYFTENSGVSPNFVHKIRKAAQDSLIEDLLISNTEQQYMSVDRAAGTIYNVGGANAELYKDGVILCGDGFAANRYSVIPGSGTAARMGYMVGTAVNPLTGDVYVQTWVNGSPGQGVELLKVHGNTMSIFIANAGSGGSAMDFDAAGNLYLGTAGAQGVPAVISKITPAAVSTQLCVLTTLAVYGGGVTQFQPQACCYAPDGNLYVVGMDYNPSGFTGSTIVRVNITTGAITNIYNQTKAAVGLAYGIAADFGGHLYLNIPDTTGGGGGGAKTQTIQKLSSVFTPVALNPNLSTLKDDFSSLDTSKWTFGGDVEIVSDRLELGKGTFPGTEGAADSMPSAGANYHYFDSAEVEVHVPGNGCQLMVSDVSSFDYLAITIDPTGLASEPDTDGNVWAVRADWVLDGIAGSGGGTYLNLGEYYDENKHKRLKIQRYGTAVEFLTSPDGFLWETLYTLFDIGQLSQFTNVQAILTGRLFSSFDNFNYSAEEPPIEYPEPPDEDGDWPLDPVPSPESEAPSGSGTATVLELIRQFSGATRAIVRLTSSTSIEIVNPNHPLPTGMVQADATSMYWRNKITAQAGLATLSHQSNDLIQTAAGDLGDDDVRVITSDWRMPNQLPVYGLRPAPVLRWNWSFSPGGCTASLDFWFPVPLTIVRRA